jgi:hypothetical protein
MVDVLSNYISNNELFDNSFYTNSGLSLRVHDSERGNLFRHAGHDPASSFMFFVALKILTNNAEGCFYHLNPFKVFSKAAGIIPVRIHINIFSVKKVNMGPYFSTNPKLTDHKRHRNRLLAPWNRMKNDERMFFSDWTHARLPEVIWIYELIHHLGARRSLDVLVAITEATFETAKNFGNTENFPFPHLGSYWKSLPTENKDFVLQLLKSDSTAHEVSCSLAPFHRLYPEYPLGFLVSDADGGDKHPDIEAFKKRLRELSDRFSLAAVRLHSHIFLAEAKSGRMQIAKGMPLPNFDLIYNENADTESDEFERSAGMVRSFVSSAFAMFTSKGTLAVADYFWNRGLELEDCIPTWGADSGE